MPGLTNKAAAAIEDYLNELENEGVDPRQFAAFAKNLVGSDDVGGDDNVPGFRYAMRVASAGYRAMLAHSEDMNDAWADLRRGRYGFGSAMKLFAKVTENYYGVYMEAARGPADQPRPTWLVVPYTKGSGRAPKDGVTIDGVLEKKQKLEYTPFQPLGHANYPRDSLFTEAPKANGARVRVFLDTPAMDRAEVGDYASFVFLKGKGAHAPIVIVVIRITV